MACPALAAVVSICPLGHGPSPVAVFGHGCRPPLNFDFIRKRPTGRRAWGTRPLKPTGLAAVISLEMGQIGRLLPFPGRHQLAVGPEKVVLLLDGHMVIVLGAIVLEPDRAG